MFLCFCEDYKVKVIRQIRVSILCHSIFNFDVDHREERTILSKKKKKLFRLYFKHFLNICNATTNALVTCLLKENYFLISKNLQLTFIYL